MRGVNLEVSARSPPYTQPVTAGRRLADDRPSQTQRKRPRRRGGTAGGYTVVNSVAYGHSEAAESEDPPDQHRARTRTSLSRPSQTQRKRLVRQSGAGWTPADPQLVAAEFERTPGKPHSQP
ncbi:hypothetical protein D320_02003 [Haloferax sp. BAB-2207]|nr:hypothetical protein D320_02003 [Haloferax sp. BAB-2207]